MRVGGDATSHHDRMVANRGQRGFRARVGGLVSQRLLRMKRKYRTWTILNAEKV